MKNPLWATYNDYLASEEWSKLRGIALDRAHHRCQVCNSSIKLHVHHRVYDSKWGEESTDDLTVLCQSCHAVFHAKEKGIRKQQKQFKKADNIAKEAVKKKAPSKKKKKKKVHESIKAKTARLSGPVKQFATVDIKAYEESALAQMEALKAKRTLQSAIK